jgi:HlyD family secretion protein
MNRSRFSRAAACAGLLAFATLPLPAAILSATGRIVPGSGVIDVFGASGSTVEAVLVRPGDWAEPGTLLARLSTAASAELRVANAEARLASLQRTTAEDVGVAQRRVAYAEANERYTSDSFERINKTRNNEFIAPDTVDQRRLAHELAVADLADARAKLDHATSDAAASIADARLALASAQEILAQAEPRAPIRARVLKVGTGVGQFVGSAPLFMLGDTSSINVIAEIFDTDALKVKPGQRATVSSPGLPGGFSGTVMSVSPVIYQDTTDSIDPNTQGTSHVVNAVIKLDHPEPFDRLIYLQVQVTIDL